jgi:hypothetical protein
MQRMSVKRAAALMSLIGLLAVLVLAQGGQRGKAETTVKNTKITIDYGRPSLHGQESRLGEATDGMVWRLGMNQATQIDTTGDLLVAGKPVKAGKYTLWAKHVSGNDWLLCFHPKTGVWGVPELKEGYIAELPLKYEKAATAVDPMTISLGNAKGKAQVKIQWGKDVLTGTFDVK